MQDDSSAMKRTWVLILGVMVLAGTPKPAYSADFVKSIQPFFAKNCYSCHSAKLKTGGLNLTPQTNLWLALLERMGVQAEKLGDSTGNLDGLTDL